jgi:hypothetical protein
MKKLVVDGMYARHPQYSAPKMSDAEKRTRQAEQHRRVVSKRQARKNGHDILTLRLV